MGDDVHLPGGALRIVVHVEGLNWEVIKFLTLQYGYVYPISIIGSSETPRQTTSALCRGCAASYHLPPIQTRFLQDPPLPPNPDPTYPPIRRSHPLRRRRRDGTTPPARGVLGESEEAVDPPRGGRGGLRAECRGDQASGWEIGASLSEPAGVRAEVWGVAVS